jgi:hypothetical protein
MKNSINLTELEKKAFKSFHEDGLWDIMIGLSLEIFMVIPLLLTETGLGDFWSSLVMLPLYVVIFWIIKTIRRKIVSPRVGLIRIGPIRRTKIQILHIIMIVLLVLGVIFGITALDLFGMMDKQAWFFPVFLSFLFLFLFAAAAFLLSCPRFLMYGIMMAFFIPAGEIMFRKSILMHHGFPAVFSTAALIIIITGMIKLVLFLKRYPKMATEDSDDIVRS